MGDLQHVHRRQSAPEQGRVDPFLDIAGQQEPVSPDLAQQDDRDVVDCRATVGRTFRHGSGIRPQDAERDRAEGEAIPRDEDPVRDVARGQDRLERGVPGSRPDHPGFQDSTDGVALEERCQPGRMVLVRMGQDHDVDPTVPRRQPFVERDQQPTRIRAAVDEHPPAFATLDEGCVTLPDIEDGHARNAVGPVHDGDTRSENRGGKPAGQQPRGPAVHPGGECHGLFRPPPGRPLAGRPCRARPRSSAPP